MNRFFIPFLLGRSFPVCDRPAAIYPPRQAERGGAPLRKIGHLAVLCLLLPLVMQGERTSLEENAPASGPAAIGFEGASDTSVALTEVACISGTESGAGSDVCGVLLTAAAPSGGFTVNLSSNNLSVKGPSSLTVTEGETSGLFTETVSAVSTTQTATLTASANGITETFVLQLTPSNGPANAALTEVACRNGTETGAASDECGVILTGPAPSGGFTVSLSSNSSAVQVPASITVPAGGTAALFTVTVSAVPTAHTATLTANASGAMKTFNLQLDAMPSALSAVSCTADSETGAAADACTVTLTAAAPGGGLAVNLSSGSSSVAVPASVMVAAGATSGLFTAIASAVTTARTATLTASAGGVTKMFPLQLNAARPALTLGPGSIAFGDVGLNSPATQSVLLTSSGTAPLTISGASITGTGFSMTGVSAPVTLNPGQRVTLNVEFDPTATGAATGAVRLTSNASSGATATVALTGTGSSPSCEVDLTWDAPANSPDPVAGYNVYRSISGSNSYGLVTQSPTVPSSYSDTTVVTGTAYTYYVESVDAEGNTSAPSNLFSVTVP